MKRIVTLLGAVALSAIMATPQQADSALSFPLNATLEFCWNPYYTLPCGFFAPLTFYKSPTREWFAYGIAYGPWSTDPGPPTTLQLNFYPPYDGSIYRGNPVGGGCVEGQMIDTVNSGIGDFRLCRD